MAVHFIDYDNKIVPPPIPCKVVQKLGDSWLCIGYKIVDQNVILYLFEDTGDGIWRLRNNFTIQECVNPTYNPALPQFPENNPWRNNERVGRMSLHILNGKPVVLFQSMYDHVNTSVDSRWKLHLATFNPSDLTEQPSIRCLTANTEYTLLKTSGPIIFDSIVKGNILFCGFNYGADERLDINTEHIAIARITDNTQEFYNVREADDTVKHIFLDHDVENDKVFLSVIFSQKLIYEVYPYIDLRNYLIDLDEVRTCSRLSSHLGFAGHIGFTRTAPRRISIHNTYFVSVESDARQLGWHFYDNHIVFTYVTNDNLRCVRFDFLTRNFVRGDSLANIDPVQYNICVDDNSDINYDFSHVFYPNIAYLNLRFDAVIEEPIPLRPIDNTITNSAVTHYIFISPYESQNNPLHFKLNINRDGKLTVLDSEDDNTNWFFNPDGEQNVWEPLPETGLTSEHFGKPVKVIVRRSDLI